MYNKIFPALLGVVLLGFVRLAMSDAVECTFEVTTEWPGGFQAQVTVPLVKSYTLGWMIYVIFDIPVDDCVIDETRRIGIYPDKTRYVFLYDEHNKEIYPPQSKERPFQCRGKIEGKLPKAEVFFVSLAYERENVRVALNRAINGVTEPPTPNPVVTQTTRSTTSTSLGITTTTFVGPWWNLVSTTTPTTRTTRTPETTTTVEPPNLADLNLRYNLRDVLTKSLLFFESQRSGLLPPNNRIAWRSHSALRDGSDANHDLSGGYYNDGGYIKYGFPMAFSTTMMAWGLLEFRNAYLASYQIPHVMNALKWATDYFIKCHVSKYKYYGQVSTPKIDEAYWGRAEDYKKVRPSFKITRFQPGSDLAAETAAALAATAMVFKNSNLTYSRLLIKHAKELYTFADRYRGLYHESIPEAAQSYKSWSGYWDELAWGAAWLHKATGEQKYLDLAKHRFSKDTNKDDVTTFSWDDKRIGAATLLAQLTNENTYKYQISDFCDSKLPNAGGVYTRKGLLYVSEWGPNRHAANIGVICLMAAKMGLRSDPFRRLAHSQLSYILGDGGQSYVVGFGDNFPLQPHHRGSSCPDQPATCTWADKEADRPNPNMLIGAMVGGPDKWDKFDDSRDDFQQNGVALDYNAGLQTLAAGILELQVTGQTFSEPNPEELQSQILRNFAVKHDYDEVLRKSLLFYEAQRSGELPPDNRIPWRKSAFVNDSGSNGEDLSGGYFDAGDYVKFNFPMAFTTTVLAWGMQQYREAYEEAGEMENAMKAIKWATDYFIKCHVAPNELYAQVGSGKLDHNHWTTPDRMTSVKRPAFKITSSKPGSELAGETAAALAAAAVVFSRVDFNYSKILITHSRQLYNFAVQHREIYHRSVPDVKLFYRSFSGFHDELAWAATWLYIATQDRSFLHKAEENYRQIPPASHNPLSGFNWDQKTPGVQLLLAQITKKMTYIKAIRQFCNKLQPEHGAPYTPRGLLFLNEWGPLRHAAGAAYICLGAANIGIESEKFREFGKRQIHYMLGDSGLGSYVVGYGANPPTRPHHRSSSCPDNGQVCGYEARDTQNSNPHILYGALVGGPNINDEFTDDRTTYKTNEVALDYNACFQSAIAALKYLELHPPPTTTPEPTTSVTTPVLETTRAVTFDDDALDVTTASNEFGEFDKDYNEIDWSLYNSENDSIWGNETSTAAASTVLNVTSLATPNNSTAYAATRVSVAIVNSTHKPNTTSTPLSTFQTSLSTTTTSMSHAVMPSDVTTIVTTSSTAPTRTVMTVLPTTSTKSLSTLSTPTQTPKLIVIGEQSTTEKSLIFKGGICNPIKVFNYCVIIRSHFPKHPLSRKFNCRYSAFKDCVARYDHMCTDQWSYWIVWNSDASDKLYFTEAELKCKEIEDQDKQKCLVRGMKASFDECMFQVQSIPLQRQNPNTVCRWDAFLTCVNAQVGHCKTTWKVWKYWNINKGNPHFTKQERMCSACTRLYSRNSLFVVIGLLVMMFT